jgi:hypothetical protein
MSIPETEQGKCHLFFSADEEGRVLLEPEGSGKAAVLDGVVKKEEAMAEKTVCLGMNERQPFRGCLSGDFLPSRGIGLSYMNIPAPGPKGRFNTYQRMS